MKNAQDAVAQVARRNTNRHPNGVDTRRVPRGWIEQSRKRNSKRGRKSQRSHHNGLHRFGIQPITEAANKGIGHGIDQARQQQDHAKQAQRDRILRGIQVRHIDVHGQGHKRQWQSQQAVCSRVPMRNGHDAHGFFIQAFLISGAEVASCNQMPKKRSANCVSAIMPTRFWLAQNSAPSLGL